MPGRKPRATRQFQRDWRRMESRGRDMSVLRNVMTKLIAGEPLQPHRRPHPLKGEYRDCMECHLGGDWLLIWRIGEEEIVFVRTGTHQDLFG